MSMTRDLQMNAKIGDAGACGLGEGLKTNSSLKKLILVRCACFGLCIICGYCAFCKRLFGVTQRLQAGNQVGDAGALGLAMVLKSNSCLTGLGLSSNQVAGAGARVLGDALRENSSLEWLNLVQFLAFASGVPVLKRVCYLYDVYFVG